MLSHAFHMLSPAIKCYHMLITSCQMLSHSITSCHILSHAYHILSHAYHILSHAITCYHMLSHPFTYCHIQLHYTLTPMLSHSYSSMLSDNCTMQKYVCRDESKLLHESGTLKADYKNKCYGLAIGVVVKITSNCPCSLTLWSLYPDSLYYEVHFVCVTSEIVPTITNAEECIKLSRFNGCHMNEQVLPWL